MLFLVNFNSALRALRSNSKRTVLSMLGIIIGIASVISILSIGKGFEKDTVSELTNNNHEKVEIQLDFIPTDTNLYETNTFFFNDIDLTYINNIEGVKFADYSKSNYEKITKNVLIKENYKPKLISLSDHINYNLLVGRKLNKTDSTLKSRVAIIDSITANELYGSPENSLNNHILIDEFMFEIVGVYNQNGNKKGVNLEEKENIVIPSEVFIYLFGENKDTTRLTILLQEDSDSEVVVKEILKTMDSKGFMREMGKYNIFDTVVFTESMKSILNNITYFIGAVASISLLIAGVGIMNMMYISVYERTREIAIKRAIGFTQKNILLQFLLEGIIITTIGGLIGYLVGIILASAIGKIINITIIIDLFSIMLAIGVSGVIGIIFTIIPAYEASKKSLISILK